MDMIVSFVCDHPFVAVVMFIAAWTLANETLR
jgi:hypothetical protein